MRPETVTDLFEKLLEPPAPGHSLFTWERGGYVERTWTECAELAGAAAGGLRAAGVESGAPVAGVLENTVASAVLPLATWLTGGAFASLPTQAGGESREAYLRSLLAFGEHCGAPVLAVGGAIAEELRALDPSLEILASETLVASTARPPSTLPSAEQPAFVQYSAGSTGEPRGCVLSAAAIGHQLDILDERVGVTPHDRFVSWLPLSHDMGLFGVLLASWTRGMKLWLAPPMRFLLSAGTWMSDCAQVGATITASPSFGVDLAARGARRRPPERLTLRRWIVGSDHVAEQALRAAVDALGPSGLEWTAFVPGYGLAEATLVVTMTRPGEGPRVAELPSENGHAHSVVSAGPPLRGVEIRIAGEGSLGEVVVRSPTLSEGYLGDDEGTRARFREGELWTRDLGFLRGEDLFIVGRMDDTLSVAGRTVLTQQVEAEIEAERHVRPGSCVVTEAWVDGAPRIVLIAEPRRGAPPRELARELHRAVVERVGIGVDYCLLVPAGAVPKTPSGKKRRFEARRLGERLLGGGGDESGRHWVQRFR